MLTLDRAAELARKSQLPSFLLDQGPSSGPGGGDSDRQRCRWPPALWRAGRGGRGHGGRDGLFEVIRPAEIGVRPRRPSRSISFSSSIRSRSTASPSSELLTMTCSRRAIVALSSPVASTPTTLVTSSRAAVRLGSMSLPGSRIGPGSRTHASSRSSSLRRNNHEPSRTPGPARRGRSLW